MPEKKNVDFFPKDKDIIPLTSNLHQDNHVGFCTNLHKFIAGNLFDSSSPVHSLARYAAILDHGRLCFLNMHIYGALQTLPLQPATQFIGYKQVSVKIIGVGMAASPAIKTSPAIAALLFV